jgi:hypothetical protein
VNGDGAGFQLLYVLRQVRLRPFRIPLVLEPEALFYQPPDSGAENRIGYQVALYQPLVPGGFWGAQVLRNAKGRGFHYVHLAGNQGTNALVVCW